MAKLFDLHKIVDEFVENGGTDLKKLDEETKDIIHSFHITFGVEEEVYRAYTYQYFIEQTMFKISKGIREKSEKEKDKLDHFKWETNINTIHRFCCKAKDAKRNMYEKLNNLHYLKLVNVEGGEICL